MSWFKSYAQVKASGLVQSVKEGLVGVDLDGASEADILEYEKSLDALVAETAKQAGIAANERKEAVEIVALYEQKLAAIGILQADAEATPENAAAINAVIEQELSALEAMQADVEREKQEADDAEAELAELKAMSAEAASMLKTARKNLEVTKNSLLKAERNAEREAAKLKRQQELKGLASNTGKLTTALDIMAKKTADANAKTEALKMKGQLLGVGDEKKSDIMQQAMAKAAGKPATATMSIADRLAALKK